MTHDELKSVVLNHVPLAYQRALLEVVEWLRSAPDRPAEPRADRRGAGEGVPEMTTLQEQARAAARNHIRPGDPLPVLLRALADKIDADQAQIKELRSRMQAYLLEKPREAEGLSEYRVWPDGTVQEAEGEPAFSWMSDDFLTVRASSEECALAEVARIMDTELDAPR